MGFVAAGRANLSCGRAGDRFAPNATDADADAEGSFPPSPLRAPLAAPLHPLSLSAPPPVQNQFSTDPLHVRVCASRPFVSHSNAPSTSTRFTRASLSGFERIDSLDRATCAAALICSAHNSLCRTAPHDTIRFDTKRESSGLCFHNIIL